MFALFAWFACAGDLQGTLEALITGGLAKILQNLCKNGALLRYNLRRSV